MRHRAPRPLLDLLRRGDAASLAVVTAVAVLVLGGVAGAVLVGRDDPDERVVAGSQEVRQPETTYGTEGPEGATPTASRRPSTSPTPGETPSGSPSTTAPGPDAPTSATSGVPSRSGARVPAPPARSAPTTAAPETGTADAPQTSATTRSANANKWTVSVSADEEATFECSLDGGGYSPCGSTVTYRDLSEGTHTFAARATDTQGNTDPTPAQLSADLTNPGG